MSYVSRMLPQGTHEKGKEIRVFMPRFGKSTSVVTNCTK